MVLFKMLMEIALPKMGVVGDDDDDDFPFGSDVPPTELLCRRAKVLLPKFRLEATTLYTECLPFIFSRSK